ncbi:brassinosteroid-responsive RING protein 1-like [Nymphaea colorata]|uniref:RING-type domain-containing protein n=1 Tax=Nymphaea colorata TaxID=210225 RepID=A0A5K0WUX3_9MAGN|nr:brassinosteroid-responsive RING protein 1-like [Nymphaea colorata]
MAFPSTVTYGILIPTLMLESFHLLTPLKLLTAWLFSQLDHLVHAVDESWHEQEQTPCGGSPVPSSQMIKKTLEVMEFGHFLRMAEEQCKQEQRAACCVCLCSIERRDKVRKLHNCRHAFHQRCLDKWVDQGQHTCPLCRSPLLPLMAADSDADDHYSWLVDQISYLFADTLVMEN